MIKKEFCLCKLILWTAFVAACGLAVIFLGEAVASEGQYKPHHIKKVTVDKRKIHREDNRDYSTKQKVNQKQQQVANGGNSNNNVTVDSGDDSDYPVSTAIAPNLFATVDCFNPKTAALQLDSIGISLGGGNLVEECMKMKMGAYFAGFVGANDEFMHAYHCGEFEQYRKYAAMVYDSACPGSVQRVTVIPATMKTANLCDVSDIDCVEPGYIDK